MHGDVEDGEVDVVRCQVHGLDSVEVVEAGSAPQTASTFQVYELTGGQGI